MSASSSRPSLVLAATMLLLPAAARAAPATASPSSSPASASPPSSEPVTTGLVRPRLLERVEPVYPEAARSLGLEADVPVQLDLDQTGHVVAARVLSPVGHGFDEAALAAVKSFTFTPARKDGQPIPVRVVYVVRFRLRRVVRTLPTSMPAATGPTATESSRRPSSLPASAPVVAAILRGQLREKGTRAPLADAVVIATTSGLALRASTDDTGHFELDLPAAGAWDVTLTAAAHASVTTRETLAPHQAVSVLYYAERTNFSDYRTVVRVAPEREEISRTTLAQEEILYIPGTNGDAIRSVTTLPGLARPPFNSGLLIIEGSSPEDSAVFIGGGLVQQLFHFGALASVFNSDLIERIDYIPSNFSPRYGRVTGGIVDVVPKPGRADGFHGWGDLNLIDASALVEGPVGDGSFALAGRRSLVDLWLPFVLTHLDATITESPVYWDYQGELTQKLFGGTFNLLAFGSDDQVQLVFKDPSAVDPAIRGQFETTLWFHYLEPSWDYKKGALSVHAAVESGPSRQDFGLGPDLHLDINEWQTYGRLDLGYQLRPDLKLEGGLDIEDESFHADFALPRPTGTNGVMQPLAGQTIYNIDERDSDFEPALWYQLDWEPVKGLLIMPGARFDYDSYIAKGSVDPRLTARWSLTKDTTLKGGVGMFHERPQPPFYVDKQFGNPDLPYELALQSSLGVEEQLTPSFYTDVTGFYKSLDDLPVAIGDQIERNGQLVPEVYAPTQTGRVYGIQVLVRKELTDRWFGWIAYTLSKTERQDNPAGPVYPFEFDQTNILTLVASYKLSPRWQIGTRVLYSAGDVQTPVIGALYNADQDVYVPIPGPINAERLPAYFQLDLRIDRFFTFQSWILDAYLDVQNITNRQNVEGYSYSFDYAQREPIAGLPIIPSIGARGQF